MLERLVVVVRAEVRVDEVEQDALARPRLDRHEKRHPEEQERRDMLDVPGVPAGLLGHVRGGRQVPHAAVDHPARVAAGAEGQIVALEEDDLQPAQRKVACDARSVDAAADDRDVVLVGRERLVRNGHPGRRDGDRGGRLVGHCGRNSKGRRNG